MYLGDDTTRIHTEMNTDLAVIPGGLMSILQPHQIRLFEDVRKLYMQWMAEGGHELMRTVKIRRA
jgi:hypothetical protein